MEVEFLLDAVFQTEEIYIEFKVYYEKNKDNLTTIDINILRPKNILPFEGRLMSLKFNSYPERSEVYFKYINDTDKYLDKNVFQIAMESGRV